MGAKYAAPAIAKMLDIIEFLSCHNDGVSINEIARITNNPVNSVYRICLELENRNYLQKNSFTGQYQLGTGFYFIGKAAERRINLRNNALPLMQRLQDLTGETVHLTILRDHRMLLLEQCETINNIKIHVDTGSVLYPHCSAFGKCLLAYLERDELEQYLNQNLLSLTPNTIVDSKSMLEELAHIRQEGIGFDREEYLDGVVCVGAPIFGCDGKCIAAIGVMCPKYRVKQEQLYIIQRQVKETSTELSMKMGYKMNDNK